VRWAVDSADPWWIADRGRGGASPVRGRWSSPVLAGDGGGGRAGRGGAREVLTGDGGVGTRRCTGGSEQRWLELVARVKEGVKELGREGIRCSEGRGSRRPFIGAGGASEGGGRGSNDGVNGFNAIEDGGDVKRGIKGGNDGGASNGMGGIQGWSWAAQGGRRR
jgi:hypothetical protein